MDQLSKEQRLKITNVLMEYLNAGNWKGLFEQTDCEAFAKENTEFYGEDIWDNENFEQDCIDAVEHILIKDSANLRVLWGLDGVAAMTNRKDPDLHAHIEAMLESAEVADTDVADANPVVSDTNHAASQGANEGIAQNTSNTNFDILKGEVLEAYMKFYVEGFKHNDMSLIDNIVKYPIAYIKDGSVTMCDSYPIDPQQLKDEKQWDHSIEWKFDVTAVNEKDAHAVASAIRCRKDGSRIESVHGFYAFTKTMDGWKMYAVADTTF